MCEVPLNKCSAEMWSGFRGGLVFKAHRLLYHSTLDRRVIKKKKYRGVRTTETRAKATPVRPVLPAWHPAPPKCLLASPSLHLSLPHPPSSHPHTQPHRASRRRRTAFVSFNSFVSFNTFASLNSVVSFSTVEGYAPLRRGRRRRAGRPVLPAWPPALPAWPHAPRAALCVYSPVFQVP